MQAPPKKTRRGNPELRRVIEAKPVGASITDLEFDEAEVTDLLDVVLDKTRAATELNVSKVRQVAQQISDIAADGPPTMPQRRLG